MEIELTRHSHPQSDLRDLIEGNEVFAAQTLAVREWMQGDDRLGLRGCGMSLGHPVVATGARILTTLPHEMRQRQARDGLAAVCIGADRGVADYLGSEGQMRRRRTRKVITGVS